MEERELERLLDERGLSGDQELIGAIRALALADARCAIAIMKATRAG